MNNLKVSDQMFKNDKASDSKPTTLDLVNKTLEKRYRSEKRFRLYGIVSISFGALFAALDNI